MLRLIVWFRFIAFKALRSLDRFIHKRYEQSTFTSFDEYLYGRYMRLVFITLLVGVGVVFLTAVKLVNHLT